MSKHETWMTRRYWESVGGLLIEEFMVVRGSSSNGLRKLDGLIVLGEPNSVSKSIPFEIHDKDIICIQTKNSRLGMSVMGQALFSKELLKAYKPRSVRTVVLVTKTDSILIKHCNEFNIEVVAIEGKGSEFPTIKYY